MCKDNQLTGVWTIFILFCLMSDTTLKTCTFFSASACSSSDSRAITVPVLPTPALSNNNRIDYGLSSRNVRFLHSGFDSSKLKEYYEIVDEARPLSGFFPTHADLFYGNALLIMKLKEASSVLTCDILE